MGYGIWGHLQNGFDKLDSTRIRLIRWIVFGLVMGWTSNTLGETPRSSIAIGGLMGITHVFFTEYEQDNQVLNDEQGDLNYSSVYGEWQSAQNYFFRLGYNTTDGNLDYTGFSTALKDLVYSQTQYHQEDSYIHVGKRLGLARFYLGLGQLTHQRNILGTNTTAGIYEDLSSTYWRFGSQLHFNAQGRLQLILNGELGSDFISEVESRSVNYDPLLLTTGKHFSLLTRAQLFYAFKYGFSAGVEVSYDVLSIKRGHSKELKLPSPSGNSVTTSITIPKTRHESYGIYPKLAWQWQF